MKSLFFFLKTKVYQLRSLYNFKIHNKKYTYHAKELNKGIIMVEFNGFKHSHPFFSLISNFLAEKFDYEIQAYDNYILSTKNFDNSIIEKFKWQLGKKLSFNTWGIYKSFGVKKFVQPFKLKIDDKTDELFNSIFLNLKNKSDIFSINYNGIIVGDLLYDGYLKLYSLSTIDLNDVKFKRYVKDFILLAKFWDDFFLKNKVKYIIGCHPYYSYGLILRIGLLHKINSYYVICGRLTKFTKDRLFGGLQYLDYKFYFNQLSSTQQEKALKESQKTLVARFSGKIGSATKDIVPTRSAYHNFYNKDKRVLNENKKIKILISTHQIRDCFYAFGKNLFPDFYEWLIFLSNISRETDYDWYIKDHPPYDNLKVMSSINATYNLSKDLVRKTKNFTYLDPSTSHHQIIKDGIDFVFTIYGSVAFEYAYHGVTVLTATQNCPTRPFNFNVHSESIKDYEYKIKNLRHFKIPINQKEVQLFNFMHQTYNDFDCIFEDFSSFLDNGNFFDDYDTNKFYEFWINKIDDHKISKMKNILDIFFISNEFSLNLAHNQDRLNKILN